MNNLKVGDKIYYYKGLIPNLDTLYNDDFGEIIKVHIEEEESYHNGDLYNITRYTIKKENEKTLKVDSYDIIDLKCLFNILFKREQSIDKMLNIIIDKQKENFKYVCRYCGLSLGTKKEFKDLKECPRCKEKLEVEFDPYGS